jgi:uncharacterized protein involved in exopolysaccharide biosynthesis
LTTPRPRAPEPLVPPVPREPLRTEAPPEGKSISVVSIINILLRHRVMIIGLGLMFGFYSGLTSLMSPRLYTTEAEFMPQGARGQNQITGLAQQFGIALGGGDAGQSSAFYMDLVESRSLLGTVGSRDYSMRTDSGVVRGNLIRLYNIDRKWKDSAVQKAIMIGALKGQIEEGSAPRTGVITLTVHARRPELAVQIAKNVLDEVNSFNLNRRQAQAGAERSFVEKRLGEAQLELRQAEENLQTFLLENREIGSSPSLKLEFDRLNRTVGMRQQLYNSLAQSYEQAKIEEVRDLPVITVLEPPELPLSPDPHFGLRKTLIGVLIGMALGVLLAFLRHFTLATRATHSDEMTEFNTLKREMIGDITHPWRIVGRMWRPVPRS